MAQSMKPLYETDYHAWLGQQAAALHGGRLDRLDGANLAEEIDDMGRNKAQELYSRLLVLLMHLLKQACQPNRRTPSWLATIRVQRRDIARLLADNPSLKARLEATAVEAFVAAREDAAEETGLPVSSFPEHCPWPLSAVLDAAFLPE